MHRNRNHDDLIHSILIYSWPNKTQSHPLGIFMKYLTSLKSSFIFRVSGLGFRLVEIRSSVKSEMGPRCWHRLSSWLFPSNRTGCCSLFITRMPHVLTRHASTGMRTAGKREEETAPSMLVQCFNARFSCLGCRGAFSRQTNGPDDESVPCKGYSSGHSVQHMDMGMTSTCRKRSLSLLPAQGNTIRKWGLGPLLKRDTS